MERGLVPIARYQGGLPEAQCFKVGLEYKMGIDLED
jgi:hypothetical protein